MVPVGMPFRYDLSLNNSLQIGVLDRDLPESGTETISIPSNVYRKLEERLKGTKYASVSEYVTSLLESIIGESEKSDEHVFSKQDEEAVDKRLRALGYVD